MKAIKFNRLLTFIVISINFVSCSKYLNEKPDSKLYVPESLQDLQALLDMNAIMNFNVASSVVELLTDNYYIRDQRWDILSAEFQGIYVWDDTHMQINEGWKNPYSVIYTANVVLENLDKLKSKTPQESYNNVEGSALFYRAFSFFSLLQLYAKPFSSSSNEDLGIVLKLSASITENISRSSVKEGYEQVVGDLKKCMNLLPKKSLNIMRPGQTAAKALLARVYLAMSDFENAALYSGLAIQDQASLIDYNDLEPKSAPLLPLFLTNPEIIFFSSLHANSLSSSSTAIIDSTLYGSYESNDIRKLVFFTSSSAGGPGTFRFKGSYYNVNSSSMFYGLSSDEMYFIQSECLARKGKLKEALSLLNFILKKRYVAGSFIEYESSNPDHVLEVILKERRKELLFRGLRWTDIRRLNIEGKNIEVKRFLKGSTYVLEPNELRSILLIPEMEVSRSGITQNPRL